ncbi:hypothetical protein PROFUN_11476 [Planoprotostelium fungivorum]|uniref:Bulb-type lectin domain-containing protein n=1 Tax=Planoprotostelium fungivorum TaxID=1890364 RepID=A0A2P6N9V2_9EUKA|nr:hypothetical protein PROFUN_11476 [Planoprotostelium fungivorum]
MQGQAPICISVVTDSLCYPQNEPNIITTCHAEPLARLAQSVERTALNRVVGGSSPPSANKDALHPRTNRYNERYLAPSVVDSFRAYRFGVYALRSFRISPLDMKHRCLCVHHMDIKVTETTAVDIGSADVNGTPGNKPKAHYLRASTMRTTLFIVAMIATALSMDLSDKRPLWDDGMKDYPLPSAAYKLQNSPDSGNCKVEICDDGRPISNTWVVYEDGPRILVCICNNAFMNLTGMAYRQGQVPIAVRSSVATITAGSDGKGGGAWTTFNDIAYFGDFMPNVFIHESGHALDFAQGNMYGSMGLSEADQWHSAIDSSSCVPDNYAKTDEAEDWAQNTVLRYWAKVLGKPWDNDETSCLKDQLKYAMEALPERPAFDVKSAFRISPINNKNLALATLNDSTSDNSPVALVKSSNRPSQLWKIMPTAYDWHILCEGNSYKCLDNERDDNVGKEAVITYRTAFVSMQHRFVNVGSNTYKIIHRTSGLALSVGCNGRPSDRPSYVEDGDDACLKWIVANSKGATCDNTVGSVLSSDATSTLYSGQQVLTSPDCNLRLVMQPDGNVVVYQRDNRVRWASGSFCSGPNKLVVQPDGNLVVYDQNMEAQWSTGTYDQGKGPYKLNMDNNAKLTLRDSTGSVLWTN